MNYNVAVIIVIALVLSFFTGLYLGNQDATKAYEQKYFENWRDGYLNVDESVPVYNYETRKDMILYYGGVVLGRIQHNETSINLTIRRYNYVRSFDGDFVDALLELKRYKATNTDVTYTFCPPRVNESGVGICYYT